MARTNAVNFSGALQFPMASAATDVFQKEDVQILAQAVDLHVHDGTGKGLPIANIPAAAIPDGSITSAKIVDGTIATVDIAAQATYQTGQANGVSSNPVTTSSALADMPDMVVTLTTTGGDVLLWFVGTFTSPAPTAVATIGLSMDGANLVNVILTQPVSANALVLGSCFTLISAPAAVTHTFKALWAISAGTLGAYAVYRNLMAVELKK